MIIVRTAVLRFDDGTTQRLNSARTEASDRLPVAMPVKVHIKRMTVVDADIGKVSGPSSTHIDAGEDAYHSKVHNCL